MRYSRSTRRGGAGAAVQDVPLKESWQLLGSTYSVVISGTLMISVSEGVFLYVLVGMALCAAHALLIGPRGRPYLARDTANVLALLFFVVSVLENWLLGRGIITCMGHFLVAVLFIKLYERKPIQGYRLIQVDAVLLITLSGAMTESPAFLPAFVLCAVSLIWHHTTCEMHHGLQMAQKADGERTRPAPSQAGKHLTLPRLALTTLLVFLSTAILFVLFPRFQTARAFACAGRRPPVVGFGDTVSLDVIGKMSESDDLVMKAEFTSPDPHRRVDPSPILMRGRSLVEYEGGRWSHSPTFARYGRGGGWAIPSALDFTPPPDYLLQGVAVKRTHIQQDIRLEPIGTNILFGLYRPVSVDTGQRSFVRLGLNSHEIKVFPPVTRPLHYRVKSMQIEPTAEMLRKAGVPEPAQVDASLLEVPEDIKDALAKVAEEIEKRYAPLTDYDRVLAVMRYLEEGGRFVYSLNIPDPGNDDPLVAFLCRTRCGTCAHFASAMCMLLRIWGIPTRLVMGFKEGTPTDEKGVYLFRQKDAHAWVEVRFNTYGWLPFDPSPPPAGGKEGTGWASERDKGILGKLDRWAASFRTGWFNRIIDYDYGEQREALLTVARAVHRALERGIFLFRIAWPAIVDSTFVLVTAIISITGMALLFFYLTVRWLVKKLRAAGGSAKDRVSVGFYRDLIAILRKKGLNRPAHLTPREFAKVAAEHLSERAENPSQVAEAIIWISDAFCRVRFGAHKLSAEEKYRIRRLLQVIASSKGVSFPSPRPSPSD